MKVLRKAEIENPAEFKIGDQIDCGFGLATCQKATEEGALFFTDDYDNETRKHTGLMQYLNSEEGLAGFRGDVRERLVPFNNIFIGQADGTNMKALVRMPFAGEMFEKDETDFLEEDDYEQLPLMKEKRNRIAFCQNARGWGWLMNHSDEYAATFGAVSYVGYACYHVASLSGGVRRAFLIK